MTWKVNLFLGRFYVSDAFRDLTYADPKTAYAYYNLSEEESKFMSSFISENKDKLEEFSEGLIKKRRITMEKFPLTINHMGERKLFLFFKLYCGMFPKEYFLEEALNDAISFGKYCEHIFAHYPDIHPIFSDLIRYERRDIKEHLIKEERPNDQGDELQPTQINLLFDEPKKYRLSPRYKWMDRFNYDLISFIKDGKLPDTQQASFLLLDTTKKINIISKDMYDLIFFLVESSDFYNAKELIKKELELEDDELKQHISTLIETNYLKVLSKNKDHHV